MLLRSQPSKFIQDPASPQHPTHEMHMKAKLLAPMFLLWAVPPVLAQQEKAAASSPDEVEALSTLQSW